jgi:hypothetical protein
MDIIHLLHLLTAAPGLLWVYVLKNKSDVFECFKDFHNLIMTQYDAQVKIF